MLTQVEATSSKNFKNGRKGQIRKPEKPRPRQARGPHSQKSSRMLIKTNSWHKINIDEKRNITAEMFFKAGEGALRSVFGSGRRSWSQSTKAALGLMGVAYFPYQLSPMKTKTALPIPAVDFTKAASSLKKIFNQTINIYVTPDIFFVTKFRDIFQKAFLKHITETESIAWLSCPKMKYWPHQRNFAAGVC